MKILVVGIIVSVFGSLIYMYLLDSVYGGGDYGLYFNEGAEYAAVLADGDWGRAASAWTSRGNWWGTSFVIHVTGLLLSLIGPTLPGAFMIYGLAGFAGLLYFWDAARSAFPTLNHDRYMAWLVLFPSLWFWPGALGKDALVLLGTGVAIWGFVGTPPRTRWLPLILGLSLLFAIRPQVAATLAFALVVGHWAGALGEANLWHLVQGVLFVAAGLLVASLAGGALGVELFDPDAVNEYVDSRSAVSQYGGSAIAGAEDGVPVWAAAFTVLLRPLPWEASGATGLLGSLEMLVLWVVIWRRRRQARVFIRTFRHTRTFWVAVIFVLVYATALGLAIGNFGILARQRVHILPFLLLFVAGAREPQAVRLAPSQPRQRLAPA